MISNKDMDDYQYFTIWADRNGTVEIRAKALYRVLLEAKGLEPRAMDMRVFASLAANRLLGMWEGGK